MKHTEGVLVPSGNACHVFWGNYGHCVATTHSDDKEKKIADAKRIADCWNAMAGIENPAKFVESMGELVDQNADLRRQRDELKAELENITNAKPSEWEELSNQFQEWAQSRARFTLAKIKGES